MKKTRVRNTFNYVQPEGKKFTQPSQTVPDQTMSLRTIMQRYASGLPIGGIKEALWDDDVENTIGINPKTLDLVDLQILKEGNAMEIAELKKQLTTPPKAEKELSEVAESTKLT